MNKRYDKFKDNNLPTLFWDDDREVFEYVYFNDGDLEVSTNLTYALGDIVGIGLYYAFTAKVITTSIENNEIVEKQEVKRCHAHSFEEVLNMLYHSPESFSISKDDEQYYSNQELDYLKKIQKYLLFVGVKDLEREELFNRYNNELQNKYNGVIKYKISDHLINNMINNKINFIAFKYNSDIEFKNYKALISDEEYNFRLFVEFINEEVKYYSEIKNVYKMDDLDDNDKVRILYFNVLEKYNIS